MAVKIMLFQNSNTLNSGPPRVSLIPTASADKHVINVGDRQQILREAALCCSMSHPNVVATYHYEVTQAKGFHSSPSGLSISDRSGLGTYKLYLIQVCVGGVSRTAQAWARTSSTSYRHAGVLGSLAEGGFD